MYNEIESTSSKRIFEISPKVFEEGDNLIGIFDADGTLIDRTGGDHWTAAISMLPEVAQSRIRQRIQLLAGSRQIFEQKYLSASSLQEFVLAGIDFREVAPRVRIRERVVDIFQYLHSKSIAVKIVSHGSWDILEAMMQAHKLDFVEVFANHLPQTRSDFIPPFASLEEMRRTDNNFLDYVESIPVVPNTKNEILEAVIGPNAFPISIGDSLGDIEMFKMTQKLHGVSILNVDKDKGKISVTEKELVEMLPYLNYIAYNPEDYSFEPASELFMQISSS